MGKKVAFAGKPQGACRRDYSLNLLSPLLMVFYIEKRKREKERKRRKVMEGKEGLKCVGFYTTMIKYEKKKKGKKIYIYENKWERISR